MAFDWIEWDLVSGYLTLEKHILLGHLLANASESRSCPCLHFQLISFYIDIISNYNSLALSHSTPSFRQWGNLAHLHRNICFSSFLLERTFRFILN